jgi:hypothetical protein
MVVSSCGLGLGCGATRLYSAGTGTISADCRSAGPLKAGTPRRRRSAWWPPDEEKDEERSRKASPQGQ